MVLKNKFFRRCKMDIDKIFRLYSRLTALKQNLPKWDINEKYVKDYHDILGLLSEETNSSLDEFKVPQEEIRPRLTSYTPSIPDIDQEAKSTYSEDRYCEKTLFLTKVDALLSYFKMRYLSEEKPNIGFKSSEE